jgi:hypothetical protein
MAGHSGAADPTPPIDWSGPGPRVVWEDEPEPPKRFPRRWLVATLLVLLLAVGGIVAGVATGGGGDRRGGPTMAVRVPLAVGSLTASVISPVEVELRWSATPGAVEYAIFRDGEALTTIRAPAITYRDVSVSPESSYRYEVAAVDASGQHSGRAIATAATPPPPPLSEARLEGRWDVTLTFLEESYTNRKKGDRFTEIWEFVPRCDEGACDVRVELFYEAQKRTIIHRDGRTYRGEGEAKLDRCQGVRIDTTIALKITVTEADFIGGAWRAIGFTGTNETDSPAALTCGAGHGVMRLQGEPR